MKPTPWSHSRARKRLPYGNGWFTVTVTYSYRNWIPQVEEIDKEVVKEDEYKVNIAYTTRLTGSFQKPFRFKSEISEIEDSIRQFLDTKSAGLTFFADKILVIIKELKAELDAKQNPAPSKLPDPIETLGIPYSVKRFNLVTINVSGIKLRISLGIRKVLQTKTILLPGDKGVSKKKEFPNRRASSVITLSQDYHIEVTEIDPHGNPVGYIYAQVFEKGVYTIRPDFKNWLRTIKNLSEPDITKVAITCDELQAEVEERFDKKPKEIDKKWKPK